GRPVPAATNQSMMRSMGRSVLMASLFADRPLCRVQRTLAPQSIARPPAALEALPHALLIQLTGEIRCLEPHHVDDAEREREAETENPREIPHDGSFSAPAGSTPYSAEVLGREIEPMELV